MDTSWTLFLDRDGVINIESVGSYITSTNEFVFLEGALTALRSAANLFGHIVVVSNQRGVGRGIMTLEALRDINLHLKRETALAGGRIDKIYNCTAVSDEDPNRKPNVGMALQAKEHLPGIDFKKCIMVGNSLSDMEFGKRLNMHTVFITTKSAPLELPHNLVDEQYPSLAEWVDTLIPAHYE